MSDKKKKIIVMIGCMLILVMVIVAIAVPSAEKPKQEKEVQISEEVTQSGSPVSYDMLVDMPAGYVFESDPLVQSATSHYVDVLNGLYEEKGSEEKAECMTLQEAFAYAGVSESVYSEVMKYHGKEYQNNPDIQRVRENGVAYDKDRTYFLITSKTDTNLYYVGESKNKRPQGCGAIFENIDGNLTLKFAGTFDNGSKKGKGISFSSYGPILFIEEIAKYEEGHEKGKVHQFNVTEKQNIQNKYNALAEMINSYKDAKALFAHIQREFRTTDIEAAILKWLVRDPYTLYLDQPVIKCSTSYIGKMKNGQRSRGRLYDLYGSLVYKGNMSKPAAVVSDEGYPLYTKAQYLETYMQNAGNLEGGLYYASGRTEEEKAALANEFASNEIVLDTVSANDLIYKDLPQKPLYDDEEEYIYDPNDYSQIYNIPFRTYTPSTYTPQTPAQTPSQSYEPPEPEADDTGTTVIDIGLE